MTPGWIPDRPKKDQPMPNIRSPEKMSMIVCKPIEVWHSVQGWCGTDPGKATLCVHEKQRTNAGVEHTTAHKYINGALAQNDGMRPVVKCAVHRYPRHTHYTWMAVNPYIATSQRS